MQVADSICANHMPKSLITSMLPLRDQLHTAYQGKTVLITGHTGFKGSWLCEWLLMLGARVVGLALPPVTEPALFDQLNLSERIEHHILDIRDGQAMQQIVLDVAPDYLFHLAAQSLVRRSYGAPVDTYTTNVMGTVHVLEALRVLDARYRDEGCLCAAVLVTTDKCYENREWLHAYREEDPLGGYDPYSASKAACEIAIKSYRCSFFNSQTVADRLRISVSSARAGNVIGGGDWAEDRIVPDCIRHLQCGKTIIVRNPTATRPWQHVLEPLHGYLLLGMHQYQALMSADSVALSIYGDAFNFGPELASNRPVRHLVESVLKHWPGEWEREAEQTANPHEAGKLNLAWDKAFHRLRWLPRWGFDDTVRHTMAWYRAVGESPEHAKDCVRSDILAFSEGAPTVPQFTVEDPHAVFY
jgi:CDP-glucose 4,6-dehydratase